MNALGRVLGVKALVVDKPPLADPVQTFLAFPRDSELQTESSLAQERKTLENKEQLLEETLSDVVPQLKEYLHNFQSRLDALTKDLNFIKGKSTELNQLLRENSSKLAKISPLVNDLVISPEVVQQLLYGKIDASYIESISYLNDKLAIYDQYKNKETPKDYPELCELLHLLKQVCIERSKRFIVVRIKRLRNREPVPSQQVQKELLDVREIFQFISQNNLSLALELRQAYTYTIRWYYKEYFSRYIRSLTILQFVNITQQYALGQGLSTSSSSSSYGSYLLGRSILDSSSNNVGEMVAQYFQVSKRLSVLRQEDNTVMVSQIAENNKMQYYLETGFRNLNLAILDNCGAELNFLNDFFHLDPGCGEELRGLLEQIFQPTFENAIQYTEQLVRNTYDIYGVLLAICLAHYLQFEAQKRKVPVMDDFLNSQLLLLWPKFQRLVDFQCESLRQIPASTAVAQVPGASKDPLITPHELTVQFSKFLAGMLILSSFHRERIDEKAEPLYNSITRIRSEFENTMNKCSRKSSSPEKFLVINYMYLLNALQQNLGYINQDDNEPLILKDTRDHLGRLIEMYSKS
ncbi:AaceriADR112Wp [[Ashbya] aceris (nom. inval.)]|nr:AaceriADR112Wp [[Ashbya] aceris (nom. inval.)]